ncbi:PPR repeat-containing protein, partial [Reticulomyxa filosa]
KIIQCLKENPFQDISIYSAAVKKCSKLKCPNLIKQIIEIAESKNIHPNIIFYNTVLYHLGVWNKFDLQENYFEQWFEQQQVRYGYQSLIPDIITFSTMIRGCANRGDIKQALHYLILMTDTYKIEPNLITFTSLLSVCANAHDIKNAELIWNKMINDPNIDINIIAISSMLNVYAKCRETEKMMEILNYSQRPEKFIPINEITCTTIMSGFLKANKVKEMLDFYDNQIPKLASNNKNIDLQNKLMISLKSIVHLRIMKTLNGNEIKKLSFHHQKFLDIFENKLYPDAKHEPTSISLKDVNNLIQSYVELNKKSWMKGVKDIEEILFQNSNYIHSLKLNETFKNGPIQILCGISYFSRMESISGWTLPKRKIIQNELKKWK